MKTVTIPLASPIPWHNKTVSEVVLREPRYEDFMELGDPYTVAFTREGGLPFVVENADVTRQYVERCMVEPASTLILGHVDLKTARKIKKAMLDFFLPDAEENEGSTTSQTSSSSAASGNPTSEA
jgi:hypothetical protein